jgi:integrase
MATRQTGGRKRLNDRFLRTYKLPDGQGRAEFTDTEARGLTWRVTAKTSKSPNGQRAWFVRYRPKGADQRRAYIGSYSPTDPKSSTSLEKARARALEIVAAAKQGRDLIADEERKRREEAARARTVGAVIAEYVTEQCKPPRRKWKQTKRLLEMHVVPHIGEKRLVDLHRTDINQLMTKLASADLRAQVNRARSAISAVLNWAIEEKGYLELNPASATKRRKDLESPRGRVLSTEELWAIWRAADQLANPSRALVKVLMLTGQRRDEIRRLSHAERVRGSATDWLIPATRMKGRRDHIVPMPPAAVEIINALPRLGPFLFTVSGKKPYGGQKRLKAIVDEKSGVTGWTFHDLRRTASSGMAKLGISQDVIDAVLAHAKGKLARVYNVHDYLEEKRAALSAWAERVADVVAENGR